MKPSRLGSILALSLVLVLGACSSSQTKEDENIDVIPAATDAGTDAIPQPTAEAPPMPGSDTPPGPAESTPPVGGSGQTESYTVQKGDTLMKIAFETLGDVYKWKEIYEANKDQIQDPNTVPSGITLKIEKPGVPIALNKNGERYLIKNGDTLGKISNELYGTEKKWKEIWENNKQLIKNPNRIFAGFYLYYVPASGGAPVPTPSEPLAGGGAVPANPSPAAAVPGTDSAQPPAAQDAAAVAPPGAPPAGNGNPQ